jgi:IstB-like ATP binding protein
MSQTAELAHLFRALKAPAAARSLPKLAERARAEEWSDERFCEALLATEVASRSSSGGELRIRAARFPARKTLEEFDFAFCRSLDKASVLHLAQLDFLHARERRALGATGDGKEPPGHRHRHPRLPGWPAGALSHGDRVGGALGRGPARRKAGRGDHPPGARSAARLALCAAPPPPVIGDRPALCHRVSTGTHLARGRAGRVRRRGASWSTWPSGAGPGFVIQGRGRANRSERLSRRGWPSRTAAGRADPVVRCRHRRCFSSLSLRRFLRERVGPSAGGGHPHG